MILSTGAKKLMIISGHKVCHKIIFKLSHLQESYPNSRIIYPSYPKDEGSLWLRAMALYVIVNDAAYEPPLPGIRVILPGGRQGAFSVHAKYVSQTVHWIFL